MGEVSSQFSKRCGSRFKTPKCRSHLIGLNQMLLIHRGYLSLVSCALHSVVVGVHFCHPSCAMWFCLINIYIFPQCSSPVLLSQRLVYLVVIFSKVFQRFLQVQFFVHSEPTLLLGQGGQQVQNTKIPKVVVYRITDRAAQTLMVWQCCSIELLAPSSSHRLQGSARLTFL